MDYRLMEFGFSINAEHKINKKVVRRYARGVVPDVILDRTDKMGFVSPQESWQRDYLKKPIEDAYRKLHSTGTFLDMKVEDEILRKFLVSGNHWQRVWRVYCYAQWLELNLN
jgi:asparagine synthase (glutamine-hydrolysing)